MSDTSPRYIGCAATNFAVKRDMSEYFDTSRARENIERIISQCNNIIISSCKLFTCVYLDYFFLFLPIHLHTISYSNVIADIMKKILNSSVETYIARAIFIFASSISPSILALVTENNFPSPSLIKI